MRQQSFKGIGGFRLTCQDDKRRSSTRGNCHGGQRCLYKKECRYLLKTNIEETGFDALETRVVAMDAQLAEFQEQMLDNSTDYALMEELGFQADNLRGDRQDHKFR
jgi:hypothetical protein